MTRVSEPAEYPRAGFTLIELSMVLLILSLVVALSLKIATDRTTATYYRNVNTQMDEIEDAIYAFRTANGRLPCPADPTIDPSDGSFGIEGNSSPGSGTCNNANLLKYPTASSTHKAGAVPVRTLGLPDDVAIDPWGKKLMYAVKIDATESCSFDSHVMTSAWPGTLFTINDESGGARSTSALYVLMSFGKNGHGAYMLNNTRRNTGSTNVAELENCDCTSGAVANSPDLNLTFVQQPQTTTDPTNPLKTYDDVVRFKTRTQLASYSELNGITTTACTFIYFADEFNNRIRKINLVSGIINTVAGSGASTGWCAGSYSGDGGLATAATLNSPTGVAVDGTGNIYITDTCNCRIRKVTASTGIITTVAGTGSCYIDGDGGLATSARIQLPTSITFDSSGNFYFTDGTWGQIRKVTLATGIISTVAGGGASNPGTGGAATSAVVDRTQDIYMDSSNNFYIAEDNGPRIRKVTAATGIISQYAGVDGGWGFSGDGGAATSATFNHPSGITFDSLGNGYIADTYNVRIRKVAVGTGIVTTIAGTGWCDPPGDGGLATAAGLCYPSHLVFDSSGNLLLSDSAHHTIRKINMTTGIISSLAGSNSTSGFSGDGGLATSAILNNPASLTFWSAPAR